MDLQTKYLELLKGCLTRLLFLEKGASVEDRIAGTDWPQDAETMIGVKRLANIKYCIEQIVKDHIQGDVIECGVWRGGACIWMKAILDLYSDKRKVFVADSFNGFPEPKFNWDKGAEFLDAPELKVSRKEVEENFRKYNLLDDCVEFVEGFFGDTLPKLNNQFSLIRADGDLFESTIDILSNLYPKLAVGGYIIIDDYYSMKCCSEAVNQYRTMFGITEQLRTIDPIAVYWRKEKERD